jgi:alpha-L-fucosidase
MAKDAGMKYIVITSKHHDGFCLWDSKISDYDIIDRTPFKRDVLKELSEACKKEGIKFCFYHSIMDWHHPDAQGNYYPDYNDTKRLNPNFSNYAENYMKPQLKELLTGYGDLGVLWFDGEWIGDWTEEQGRSLYNYVRSFQPDIIINNRVGKGRRGMQGMNEYEEAAGDFGTPEQEILEGASTLDWESCMTMNDHWGYASYDTNFKSTDTLIYNLVDIAAKGGNYLLNIGPTAEGLFPQESIDRLKEIGEWMKINSEVIHESGSLKNYKETETLYYVTGKEKKYIYAISTTWPGTSLRVKYVVPDEGTEIELLGFDEPLNWTIGSEEGVIIDIPEKLQEKTNRPCQYAWIFKIEGKPAKVNE